MAHSKDSPLPEGRCFEAQRETPPLPCPGGLTERVMLSHTELKKEINAETSKHEKEGEGPSETHRELLGHLRTGLSNIHRGASRRCQRNTHGRWSPRDRPRLRDTGRRDAETRGSRPRRDINSQTRGSEDSRTGKENQLHKPESHSLLPGSRPKSQESGSLDEDLAGSQNPLILKGHMAQKSGPVSLGSEQVR